MSTNLKKAELIEELNAANEKINVLNAVCDRLKKDNKDYLNMVNQLRDNRDKQQQNLLNFEEKVKELNGSLESIKADYDGNVEKLTSRVNDLSLLIYDITKKCRNRLYGLIALSFVCVGLLIALLV